MDKKERIVLFASFFLVITVFASATYYYLNPPVHVLEAKVFDVFHKEEKTIIWTYGKGTLTLKGFHDIVVDEIYRVTYRGWKESADILISIEKIS
jgi:hypothetical protein